VIAGERSRAEDVALELGRNVGRSWTPHRHHGALIELAAPATRN
jgi:hypothetical protein